MEKGGNNRMHTSKKKTMIKICNKIIKLKNFSFINYS